MDVDTILQYPAPYRIRRTRQYYKNRKELEINVSDFFDGAFRLTKNLLPEILIVHLLLSPFIILFDVLSADITLNFTMSENSVIHFVVPSFSVRFMFYWILLLVLAQRAREYHEDEWLEYESKRDFWEESWIGSLHRLYSFVINKRHILFRMFVFSLIVGGLNLFFFSMGTYLFKFLYSFGVFIEIDRTAWVILFKTIIYGYILSRIGMVPMILLREEKSIANAISQSIKQTYPYKRTFTIVYFIVAGLFFAIPSLLISILFITMICQYYLVNSKRFELGRIWPSSKYKKEYIF